MESAAMKRSGITWDRAALEKFLADPQELVRGNYLGRTHIGLDFFDASINRLAAWTIGARNMIRAAATPKREICTYR